MSLTQEANDFKWRTLMAHSPIGLCFVSATGQFLEVNPALCQMFGYAREELLTLTFQELSHPDDLKVDLAHVEAMLSGAYPTYTIEKRYFRKDGTILWTLLAVSGMCDQAGNLSCFVSQLVDLTEQKRLLASLEAAANQDSLTGLWSRRSFDLFLEQHCHGRTGFALFLFDLNEFKRINDTHGHQTGDRCLQWVAAQVQRTVRMGDVVARIGGDEFCILAEGLDKKRALKLAQRLSHAIAAPLMWEGLTLHLEAALGIHLYQEGESPGACIKAADQAMYAAKAVARVKGYPLYCFSTADCSSVNLTQR